MPWAPIIRKVILGTGWQEEQKISSWLHVKHAFVSYRLVGVAAVTKLNDHTVLVIGCCFHLALHWSISHNSCSKNRIFISVWRVDDFEQLLVQAKKSLFISFETSHVSLRRSKAKESPFTLSLIVYERRIAVERGAWQRSQRQESADKQRPRFTTYHT
jgi:hypothetical protein